MLNTVKLAAHAQGLVFVDVSNKTVKRIVGKSVANLTASKNAAPARDRPSWESAIKIRETLTAMNNSNGPNGWCQPTLTPAFKRRALLMNVDAWRTDTLMVLAYQTVNNNVQCVGVCSFGEADQVDRTFNDNGLENAVGNGRVLEIDLLCTRNGSQGTGTILLAYCIAKQLQRKSRGQNKYTDVIIPLARHGNAPNVVFPALRPAQRLGFDDEPCGPGPHGQERIVSLQRADFIVPDIRDLSKLCAVKPKSGLPYCS
jgi:hypothetical protein